MRSLSLLLVALIGLTAVSASTVPVYMWTTQSYFPTAVCSSTVSAVEVQSAFNKLTGVTQTSTFASTYVKSTGVQPQTIVSFIYPTLSTPFITKHDKQFAYLKEALKQADSSLSVPYVTSPIALSATGHHMTLATNNGCDSVLKTIANTKFTGKTNVFEIYVSMNDNECIAQIMSAVKSAPHVFAVTGAHTSSSITYDFEPTPAVHTQTLAAHTSFQAQAFGPKGAAYVWSGPQYISSNILVALLVGLMLIFILYIGISCTMSIQRPVRMSTVPLQLSKEY